MKRLILPAYIVSVLLSLGWVLYGAGDLISAYQILTHTGVYRNRDLPIEFWIVGIIVAYPIVGAGVLIIIGARKVLKAKEL
jgi:hypothetical protein